MTTFAIGIVAHSTRAEAAKELALSTQADVLVMDHTSRGERWCHQEALRQLIPTGADWLVLLEDDALPCDNFRQHLRHALDEAGDAIVSLYLGTGRWAGMRRSSRNDHVAQLVADADRDNARWIDTDALWHAVAVAIPQRHATDLLAHLEADHHATDRAITNWTQGRIPVRYTWPSLVDHADGPRVVPKYEPFVPRHAWRVQT